MSTINSMETEEYAEDEEPQKVTQKKPASKATKGKGGSTQVKRRKSTVTGKKKKAKGKDGDVDDQGEYAVEKIVDKRVVNGKIEYFIKWQGWPSDANTWEPIEHLANCHLMIQTYEAKLAKKQPGKRGRPGSNSSDAGSSKRGGGSNGYGPLNEDVLFLSDSDDDAVSGVDYYYDDDLEYPLTECPKGKELAKIHGVAVVDGYLTFLVQWKTPDCVDGQCPPISSDNASMVRAASMNRTYPQEVIKYYQNKIRFNVSLDSQEEEARKAAMALLNAKERRNELQMKRVQAEVGNNNDDDDDDDDDPVTKAIEKERRGYDKFDPTENDLSSSSSDEDDLLEDSDEED